jgi:hypothetical protein
MTPTLVIRHRPDLSLTDLQRIQTGGGAVMRSAHFGNWSPSNLSVAALGLRCVLVNTTMTGRDTTYHPSGVIVGRRFHPGLAAPGNALVVLSRVRRTPDVPGVETFFDRGANLADAHLDALAQAVPGSVIETYQDYLRRHQDLAAAVLEICADAAPELWRRQADATRGVSEMRTRPRNWAEVSATGVLGLSSGTSGWLIPKAIIILTMAVIDALTYRSPEVYHLSGPSMVHYVSDLDEALQRLYQAVAGRLSLPDQLLFNLAPTALMTLGAPSSDQPALDRLVDAWLTARAMRSRPGSSLPKPGPDRKAAYRQRKADRFRAYADLAWAAVSCATPFHGAGKPDFCSQYDLLVRGGTWYVHPWGAQTALGAVGKMIRTVTQLRRTAQ